MSKKLAKEIVISEPDFEILAITDISISYRLKDDPPNADRGYKRRLFIERALFEAWEYHDTEKLDIAIHAGLPELLETGNKEILAAILKNEHKKGGHKPNQLKSHAERRMIIWSRAYYWKGKGLPLYDDGSCKKVGHQTALERVAEELYGTKYEISADRIKPIFQELKALCDKGDAHLMMLARMHSAKGSSEGG